MAGVICVIPRDSVERAMQSDRSLIEDFSELTYSDFISGTVAIINEIGVDVLTRTEESARRIWYMVMAKYDYWGVGNCSEEDELIAYASFTYARHIIKTYNLEKHFTNKEIIEELINGDIFIYGERQ